MTPPNHRKIFALLPLFVSTLCLGDSEGAESKGPFYTSTPNLSFKGEQAYFGINGRVVFDYAIWDDAAFSGVDDVSGAGSEIRRARIYLKGGYKDWHYRLQTDFAGNKTSNKNSYIMYSGFEDVDVIIGNHKEPFGMENLSSSKHISAIERTATNGNFAGGRYIGVSVAGSGAKYGYRVGAYDIGSSDTEANYSFTGRFTYALMNSADMAMHLGASASFRQLSDNDLFTLKNRAGIHPTSTKSITSTSIQAESSQATNIEFAVQSNKWQVTAEAQNVEYEQTLLDPVVNLSTSYVQVGYFLTEDRRKYKVSSGTFGSVKPSSNSGAWEVYGRFEDIDLRDHSEGTEGTILTVGLNWFATQYTRISANYVVSDLSVMEQGGSATDVDGNAVSLRAQFFW